MLARAVTRCAGQLAAEYRFAHVAIEGSGISAGSRGRNSIPILALRWPLAYQQRTTSSPCSQSLPGFHGYLRGRTGPLSAESAREKIVSSHCVSTLDVARRQSPALPERDLVSAGSAGRSAHQLPVAPALRHHWSQLNLRSIAHLSLFASPRCRSLAVSFASWPTTPKLTFIAAILHSVVKGTAMGAG